MTGALAPAVVAYDGSDEAGAAVRQAAAVLAGRPLIIVTVWEAGLAMASYTSGAGDAIMGYVPMDDATVLAVDETMSARATQVAEQGAKLAREAGATAEAVVVADELDPADTVASVADARGAAVIVVGSRGLSGIKARLHGSTTHKLLHHTRHPVLVIRLED
jgi:nucleotide-binding universal stress UspA family protein